MGYTFALWLFTAAAVPGSGDRVLEKVRYLGQTDKQAVPECTFTIRRAGQAWSIRSLTEAGKSQMSLSAAYDGQDRLTAATATLSSTDGIRTCTVAIVEGRAHVRREGKADREFAVPPGVIVTSAPDWTDTFLLCRRYDRDRGGKQTFAGLWIHPDKEPLRLTFTIERQGVETLEHGGKQKQLNKFEIRLRNNDGYIAWADDRGRMVKLQPLKRRAGYALVLDTSAQQPSTDWPCWRGSHADGVADGCHLPLHWSKTRNIRWSVELPGWGTSSPVVYGERVFVTSHVPDKKALLTLCFDRATGKELWRHDFGFGVNQRTHAKSNLAVNTPAVAADAVYVAFGNADLARYTHDGKLVWVKRYLPYFGDPKMAWGYGVSPLVLDDSVLFPWNHHNGPCFLLGLDKKSGDFAWKKARPIGTAHATPLLVEHHDQKDLLVPGQNRLTAFDATTHAQVWCYGEGAGPYNGEIISSPVYGDGIVFVQLWRESKIHALRLNGNRHPPTPLWLSRKPGPVEASLLYYRGLLYALMDTGVLVCLDGKTGEELYRTRLGAACNSSPIAGDGHVYLSDNDGRTFVVEAGRSFKLLVTNELGERITASPAISGERVIYRTDSHLYCIGQGE